MNVSCSAPYIFSSLHPFFPAETYPLVIPLLPSQPTRLRALKLYSAPMSNLLNSPSRRPKEFVERQENPLNQSTSLLASDQQPALRNNLRSKIFVAIVTILITWFLIDFATTKNSIWLLVCVTDWLKEVDIGTCLTILILFGVFSPPLGAPFTIYPLLVSFIMGSRSGSQVEAVVWGVSLTCTALTFGAWLGFIMSR